MMAAKLTQHLGIKFCRLTPLVTTIRGSDTRLYIQTLRVNIIQLPDITRYIITRPDCPTLEWALLHCIPTRPGLKILQSVFRRYMLILLETTMWLQVFLR